MPDTSTTGDGASTRRAAFVSAEASLALEGMRPCGQIYEQARADVIAGRISFDEAAQRISASFGSDVRDDVHTLAGTS